MARFISFLAAIVVLMSAAAEIASFAIDHQSWLQQNYEAVRAYMVSRSHPSPATPKPLCENDCAQASAPRCDGVEPISRKVLCYLTIPTVDTSCTPKDCPPAKDKPSLPPDWIRSGKKGDVANATAPN
jgi:hypothetical protein